MYINLKFKDTVRWVIALLLLLGLIGIVVEVIYICRSTAIPIYLQVNLYNFIRYIIVYKKLFILN